MIRESLVMHESNYVKEKTNNQSPTLQAQKRIIQNAGKYWNRESFRAGKTSRTDFKKAYLNQSGYNTNCTEPYSNMLWQQLNSANNLCSEGKKHCCKKGEMKNKHMSWRRKENSFISLRRELAHSWKTDLKTYSCNNAWVFAVITSGLQFIFFHFYI